MPKKQLALLLTFGIAVLLIALLIHMYLGQNSVSGTKDPGTKLKDFYKNAVENSGSFFGK